MAEPSAEDHPHDDASHEGAEIIAFPCGGRDARWRDVVGDVLRDERTRQGRTLTDVADAAAVSVPYLSEIERGRKEVSSDVLHAVHTALGMDLGELLERSTRRLRPQGRGPVLLAA